ncbi:hypothetical protein TNCV_921301 [Trichonephila clavipes]|nr:hypothetical protein TNCV_921301 [Trichonephila clavipes]
MDLRLACRKFNHLPLKTGSVEGRMHVKSVQVQSPRVAALLVDRKVDRKLDEEQHGKTLQARSLKMHQFARERISIASEIVKARDDC